MKNLLIIDQLESHIPVIENLLSHHADHEMIIWRPQPEKWCLLEIICHLVDEEIHDFRKRVRLALFPDQYELEAIDPEDWVTSKRYMEQDYQSKISAWISERKTSIEWLRSLNAPNWNSYFEHPQRGKVSASFYLNNWLAHDYIHIRQITQLKRAYLNQFGGQNLEYAGRW